MGLSAARVAIDWSTGSQRLLSELGICVVGAAVGLCGWLQLRRAKADYPDLSWWQFLYDDMISVGIIAVGMIVLATLSPEQRDGLMRSLWEFFDLLHTARGLTL